MNKIPIILDTDIGSDIDDTWALCLLLASPEVDLKLVTVSTGDTAYRASIVAKLLEIAGRTEVPIALGKREHDNEGPQAAWLHANDFSLSDYQGEIIQDAASAIDEMVQASSQQACIVGIGPLTTVAETIERFPRVVENARFVGMQGSIRVGYGGVPAASAEYNVVKDVAACRKVFSASWNVTITPLDTCGDIILDGERYRAIKESGSPLLKALMENYETWAFITGAWRSRDPDVSSSVLFDTVAVYLAWSEALLEMETLPIHVTSDGYTRIDDKGAHVNCATRWKDKDAFLDLLVERLLSA